MFKFKWILSKNKKYYFASHNPTIRADLNFNIFGGGKGSTTIQQPTPPSVGATTKEAIEAEIASLPARYQAELEYRPKFTEVDLATIEQFAPRIQSLGRDFAREEKALQEELYPEATAVEKGLGSKILGGIDSNIPEDIKSEFLDRFRAEEAASGRLGSPVGSVNVARKFADLAEAYRTNRINQALSYAGRIPTLGSQGFNVSRPQSSPSLTGGLVAPALGFNSSVYSTGMSGAVAQAQLNNQANIAREQMIPTIGLGALML